MYSRCRLSGFTLLELIIVVVLICILATIAYPFYSGYVLASYRAQAKADLLEYAAMAERSHTVNNSYVSYALPADPQYSPRQAREPRYQITLANNDSERFTLTARPQNAQTGDRCGTLSINQANIKTASGDTVANCW